MATDSLDDIRMIAELAIQHGYQMAVHAIGDRGNRETLNIFEETFKRHPEKNGKRSALADRARAAHQRAGHPALRPRSASSRRCRASTRRPTPSYVLARLGPKRAEEGAYVWQKLMKSGAVIANGTDAPVEDIDPIPSFYASVSRKVKDGSVFYPDQRMSRMEALRSYTINAAFAGFDEGDQGLAAHRASWPTSPCLSKDIMTIPEDQIPSAADPLHHRRRQGAVTRERPLRRRRPVLGTRGLGAGAGGWGGLGTSAGAGARDSVGLGTCRLETE